MKMPREQLQTSSNSPKRDFMMDLPFTGLFLILLSRAVVQKVQGLADLVILSNVNWTARTNTTIAVCCRWHMRAKTLVVHNFLSATAEAIPNTSTANIPVSVKCTKD